MDRARVSVLRCARYEGLERIIYTSLEKIGALALFKDKVALLKVNLMVSRPPEEAVNTHPEFLRWAVRVIKNLGAKKVRVGESSGAYGFTDEAFEHSGIARAAAQEGAELVNFDASAIRSYRINGNVLKEVYLPQDIFDADILVTLPKMKTHSVTTISCALKNQVGLLPGSTKVDVHRAAKDVRELSEAIIDINMAVRFNLALVDGVIGLEGNGPTNGSPIKSGLVIAGEDLVAVDSVSSFVMGFMPDSVLTNKIGASRGLGIADLEKIEIIGEKLEGVKLSFKRPGLRRCARFNLLAPAMERLYYHARAGAIRPVILKELCDLCGACKAVCPAADAINLLSAPRITKSCVGCYACRGMCPKGAIKLKCKWFLKDAFRAKAKGMPLGELL